MLSMDATPMAEMLLLRLPELAKGTARPWLGIRLGERLFVACE
jgi:hypothetical protein